MQILTKAAQACLLYGCGNHLASTDALMILAEQVHEGHKCSGKPSHTGFPHDSKAMCAHSNQDPHTVVQFVLAIDMEGKLLLEFEELLHPLDLTYRMRRSCAWRDRRMRGVPCNGYSTS